MELEDGEERKLFMASMASGPYDRLIGKPYHEGDFIPLGTAGDVIFGDFAHYMLAMGSEVVIATSKERYFEYNQTAVKVYLLAGGNVVSPTSFAILGAVTGS